MQELPRMWRCALFGLCTRTAPECSKQSGVMGQTARLMGQGNFEDPWRIARVAFRSELHGTGRDSPSFTNLHSPKKFPENGEILDIDLVIAALDVSELDDIQACD